MRAAQFWAQYLRGRGVRRIFGHPGSEAIDIIEAAREAGLEFVLTQHESTGAFMAAMTGRLTGVPGVSLTTAGPGMTNVASGIGEASLDRMPLLVMTGDHDVGGSEARHQRLPPDLYAPIARASVRLTPTNIATELPRAFDLTTRHPHGPVHVTFPGSQVGLEVTADPTAAAAKRADDERPLPDLAAAERLIRAAKRPMAVVGLGLTNAWAEAELVRFAERLGIPVADTPQSRGCIPTDHPLYIGTFGTYRDALIMGIAKEADLVIALGLDSVEFLKPWPLRGLRVLSIAEVGAGDDPAIPGIEAAVNGPLRRILDALADVRPAGSWTNDEVAAHRTRLAGSLDPPTSDDGKGALWPQTVVARVRAELPDDAIATVDVGSHKLVMVLQWRVRQPRTFLNSSGISSMGTGLPFAMAAKLVHPDRAVVAVIGDGGLLMYGGELATLARLGAPVIVVVMADAALYSIKIKQLRKNYAATGTDLGERLRIADIARSFGLEGECVASADALTAAVRRALRADGPTVIEARIDPAGYEYTQ